MGQRGQPGDMGYQGDKVCLLSHKQGFKENTDVHHLIIMCIKLSLPTISKKIISDSIPSSVNKFPKLIVFFLIPLYILLTNDCMIAESREEHLSFLNQEKINQNISTFVFE